MDSLGASAVRVGGRVPSFNSIEWIPKPLTLASSESLGPLLRKPFNSIEWILHHHGLCTLWKSAHLHYLDSLLLTPGWGSHVCCGVRGLYVFRFPLHGFSHVFIWEFQLLLLGYLFMGRVSWGNVFKFWFMWGF